MEPLRDPSSLRGDPSVEFRTESVVDDPETYDYFASLAGMVAVGVTNCDGAVLLMDSPHGWRLPYGPVPSGGDWTAHAERFARATTGHALEVTDIERVTRLDRRASESHARTTTHDVVVRAGPVDGAPVASDPTFEPWDDLTVAWHGRVPDDAYHDHGDAVPDIRRFVD